MRSRNIVYLCAIGVMLSGCGTQVIKPADQHFKRPQPAPENIIPQPVKDSVVLPPPKPADKVATYSVVVTDVPAQQILFALARDAKINLDIQSGIQGSVTINAINQTLPEILTRIARQVDMRYELDNGTLTVMPDTPYLHTYKIDYVNMTRESDSSISNTSQISSGSTGAAGGASGGGNNSSLTIKDVSKNNFWATLTQNIKDILHETDKILPAGSSETSVQQVRAASSTGTGVQTAGGKTAATKGGIENSPNPVNVEEGGMTVTRRSTFREAASVIANPENGIITVRATGKQHEKIQQFIDRIMANAERQVMIEATIVQVNLSDQYQQGIDWSRALLGAKGFALSQTGAAGISSTPGTLAISYLNPTSKIGNLAASVQLLEQFGNVKVLSSPTLSVMNNQTAMLRVVDNLVYFTMTVTPGTVNTLTGTMSTPPTYTSTVQTSPVGFMMSLTPQISDSDTVLLNVRPSITRLLGYIPDPNPSLANPCLGIGSCTGVTNNIPQTSTREMESVLRIQNNQIAVLGGLMEDQINKNNNEVPLLARVPLLGNLFQNRNDTTTKTELVIFLRPIIIKNPSVNGDFNAYRKNLPDQNFFNESAYGKP
ncbi:MAG: secretin N-terminal domain-containing protein [Gallionella sp.]